MVESGMKCSRRAPEALRKDFNPGDMARLPVTPAICLLPLAKTHQGLPRGTGVSYLKSHHLHPLPGTQRWHF